MLIFGGKGFAQTCVKASISVVGLIVERYRLTQAPSEHKGFLQTSHDHERYWNLMENQKQPNSRASGAQNVVVTRRFQQSSRNHGYLETFPENDFKFFFIWRIALLKWNGFWKADLENRLKTWRSLRTDWKHRINVALSISVCLLLTLLSTSWSIVLLQSWRRIWLAQLVPSGLFLIGRDFPHQMPPA